MKSAILFLIAPWVSIVLVLGVVFGFSPKVANATTPQWVSFTNVCTWVQQPNGNIVIENGVNVSVRYHNGTPDQVIFTDKVVTPVKNVNVLPEPCLFVP